MKVLFAGGERERERERKRELIDREREREREREEGRADRQREGKGGKELKRKTGSRETRLFKVIIISFSRFNSILSVDLISCFWSLNLILAIIL